MRLKQKDQDALEKLMLENFDMGDDSFSPDMGMQDTEVVMEIEPIAPVEPVMGANDEQKEIVFTDLKKIVEYGTRLLELCQASEFEPWMVAKLSKASDYVDDVYYRLDAKVDFANRGVGDINQY